MSLLYDSMTRNIVMTNPIGFVITKLHLYLRYNPDELIQEHTVSLHKNHNADTTSHSNDITIDNGYVVPVIN